MSPETEREMAHDISKVVALLEDIHLTLRRVEERRAESEEKAMGQLRGLRQEMKSTATQVAWCALASLFFVVPQVISWFR